MKMWSGRTSWRPSRFDVAERRAAVVLMVLLIGGLEAAAQPGCEGYRPDAPIFSPRIVIVTGGSATYMVSLGASPPEPVRVTMQPTIDHVKVDPGTLSFNTTNWSTPQTVTISVVPVGTAVGKTMSIEYEASYEGRPVCVSGKVEFSVVETHQDSPGDGTHQDPAPRPARPDNPIFSPPVVTVTEVGNAVYTVVLDEQPPETVTVTVQPTIDYVDYVEVDPDTLSFTTTNWGTPQTVTISVVQVGDAVDEKVTIRHTASYSGRSGSVSGYMHVSIAGREPPFFERPLFALRQLSAKISSDLLLKGLVGAIVIVSVLALARASFLAALIVSFVIIFVMLVLGLLGVVNWGEVVVLAGIIIPILYQGREKRLL